VQQAALSEGDAQAANNLRALKQQLQAAAGSVRGIYSAIRHFKWVKTACVWRYPEVLVAEQLEEEREDESSAGSHQGHLHQAAEGSFYGLRPVQARSSAFVICSLHSDVLPPFVLFIPPFSLITPFSSIAVWGWSSSGFLSGPQWSTSGGPRLC